ncbi:unnamed protein product [Periconia digitata]|uniref:Phospholipase D/nuclease n=1 Tax=Periconia digitata TaxID=1303443 RepID=A0A9W4UBH9_9PLEO|nr:unnamed protein product [Periconia digitata]
MASPSSLEDEELRQAIAMSLANTSVHPGDEDDDDDVRRAIALSLCQDTPSDAQTVPLPGSQVDSVMGSQAAACTDKLSQYAPASATSKTSTQLLTDTSSTSKPSEFLGLDRKAMESERLARMGKRKRSASPELPSKQPTKARVAGPAAQQSTTDALQYPRGTVKRTWATKRPRSNDIKLEEVLQRNTLNIAVLSAFQFESTWFHENQIDPYQVKQIWIFSAKGEGLQEKLRREAAESQIPNFKMIFPPLPGQSLNMHGKLMLLFHPKHLRIVVPTANMIKEDWGETGNSWQPGVMENTVFLIDLPRRPDEKAAVEMDTNFGKEMFRYLKEQGVTQNVFEGLLKFDFGATAGFAFVHSIAGTTSGPERSRTGLPSLAKAIQDLKLDDIDRLEIDYATSSLGALKEPFMKQMYLAACGLSPLSDTKINVNILDHFRVYFPTKETVTNSTGGPDCGGIITLSRDFYNASTFPRQCLRDYQSTRPGLLSHNKLLFARGCKKDGTPIAWAYIGSANLSEAAWGMQKVLKSGKEGSSLVRNWECGVVVPVPAENLQSVGSGIPPMSVFAGTVDIPFVYPASEYGGREPWIFRG